MDTEKLRACINNVILVKIHDLHWVGIIFKKKRIKKHYGGRAIVIPFGFRRVYSVVQV